MVRRTSRSFYGRFDNAPAVQMETACISEESAAGMCPAQSSPTRGEALLLLAAAAKPESGCEEDEEIQEADAAR